jgi:hypothetical protein
VNLQHTLIDPRVTSLREFAAILETVDLSEEKAFGNVIQNAVHEYGITPLEIQAEFEMTKGGVNKWVNKVTKPRQLMARLVVQFIRQRVLERADELQDRSS